MCFRHFNILSGIGELGGGVLGGILGGPLGAAAGAELGGTVGGVAGGEKLGQAALGALPGAALAGVGTVVAPAVSSLFSGTTDATGAVAPGAAAPVTPVTNTPLAPLAPVGTTMGAAPVAGAGGGAGAIAAPTSVDPTGGFSFTGGGNVIAANSPVSYATTGFPPAPTTTTPVADPAGGFGSNFPDTGSIVAGAAPMAADPTAGAAGASNPLTGALSAVGDFLKANSSLALGAAGLGVEAAMQRPLSAYPGYSNVINTANKLTGTGGQLTAAGIPTATTTATNLSTQGQQLGGYLQSGTLPPGVEASLNQAAEAQKAAIRSQYAAAGMSGSSSEAADLANVDTTMRAQGVQIAENLLQQGASEQQTAASIATNLINQGVNASGLSADLYTAIMGTALQQDQLLGQGIATLAGAAARPSVTIQQPTAVG